MSRCPRVICVGVLAAACGGAAAQGATDGSTGDSSPPPRLKPAPTLEPPPLVPPQQLGKISTDRDAIFLRADNLEGTTQKSIEASGNVELRTRRQTVLADWLRYDFDTDEVWGKGNVTLRQGIDWITGPEAKFKRDTEIGFFTQPEFHVGENASRGSAKEIQFNGPNRYDIKDASYTTCVAGDDDWYLRAVDVDLDRSRLVGTAHDATIYFKGAPILYSPYLSFPLSNERKSGFLTPILGTNSARGVEFSLPYYFNLAPNYDATFTPRYMTKRGLQLNGQFRYLFPDMAGEMDAEGLDDRVTDTGRYGLLWKHAQNITAVPGLAAYVNLQKVSDDTYFADLSDRLTVTSQTNLPREGGFAYSHGPFGLLIRMQAFQTLQDPNNPITPPYFREPQVFARLDPVEWADLDFSGTGEYVRFRQPALTNADRAVLYPTVAWTRRGNAWFFTARTGLHMSTYSLDDPAAPDKNINRVVPISSLDSGLVFERDATFFDRAFLQTLEPRAYYVYIPFRNQDNIPVFDTALDDFNFSQLFTENRYLGSDRIGDANQLTLAVTSRLLDPTSGEERVRFELGQRYYFSTQRVTLPAETPRSANSSDLLLSGEGKITDTFSAAATYEVNLNHTQTQEFDIGVRWQPALGKVLNASYRYNRQTLDPVTGALATLKQVDVAGQWPVGNWSLIGRWNYSFVNKTTLEGVAGVEYNGGCWAFRVVGQHLVTNVNQVSSSVFVQFELNGLARLGTNPIDVLRRSVPGYQPVNEPTMPAAAGAEYFPRF
jgi:LPS-assembly protein